MTAYEEKYKRIIDVLKNLDDDDLILVNNYYCDINYLDDDRIYFMDELPDFINYSYDSIFSFLKDFQFRSFDINDSFFKYSNMELKSLDDAFDEINIEEIAEYIIDYDDCLDCLEIEIEMESIKEEEE